LYEFYVRRFIFSLSIKFYFYGTGIKFLLKTNFFQTHNPRTTVCILFFLRHLYSNITLKILTNCNPQGINIEVTTFCILLVESCEMVTEFARNKKINNISSKFMFVEKTSLNSTHRHMLCASVCFITCDITEKNLICFGIYSHRFYDKTSEKNLFRSDVLNVPYYKIFLYLSFDRWFIH
jgi:hypothetical protein